jgi:putative ubiquitin-RnfH superfamily antitoxin RatB of RatAB toxin-antitoxin module
MSMRVEVIFALAQEQELVVVVLPPGSKVQDAVRASGLLQRRPDIELTRVGVWGRAVTPDTALRDRDRVEIYRPLIADPKEIRRKRAATAPRRPSRNDRDGL